jgi:hypothetical protein
LNKFGGLWSTKYSLTASFKNPIIKSKKGISRMQKIKVLLCVAMVALLAACATSRSVLEIMPSSVPENTQTAATANGKAVYIDTVRDSRSFQENPPSPSIPSLDPSEASSDAIKLRAIGRKRKGIIYLTSQKTIKTRPLRFLYVLGALS